MGICSLRIWTDGTDTIIAASAEDAISVAMDMSGDAREAYDAADWRERDPDKPLRITDADGDGKAITMTGWDWIVRERRGFLCSTEV